MVLDNGGHIKPIIVPSELTSGTGTFNPSIWLTDNLRIGTIRHCQVILWHSRQFQHYTAPIAYINPEDDISLRSSNFIFSIDDDLNCSGFQKVDMTYDVPPLWEFIGLEDPRIVVWDDRLLLCGGRRDTTTTGEGRLEITELCKSTYKEIKRVRFDPEQYTYCEKNWMPINDLPWHFVRWTNPTEIYKVDLDEGTCSKALSKDIATRIPFTNFRGGSNVVTIGDHYVCLVHITRMFATDAGKKDSTYTHCFVVWNKQWDLVSVSDEFSFMGIDIEFCCGLSWHNQKLVIAFGVQDNCSFIMETPIELVENIVCMKLI